MIIGVSGHRRINHYPDMYEKIHDEVVDAFLKLKPQKVITGMALGFDGLCAEVCLELKIPFIAAVPFVGQEDLWKSVYKNRYKFVLTQAESVVIVSEGGYTDEKYHIRNRWIVDNCDELVAYYDGAPNGGTKQCIDYAKSMNKTIHYLPIFDKKNFKKRIYGQNN